MAVCNLRRASAGPPPPRTKWTRRVPHPVLIGHAASLTRAGGGGGGTGEKNGSGGGDWVGAPTGSTAGPMSTESGDVEPTACFLMGGTDGGVEGQPQLLLFVPRLAGATGGTGSVQLQLSLCDVL